MNNTERNMGVHIPLQITIFSFILNIQAEVECQWFQFSSALVILWLCVKSLVKISADEDVWMVSDFWRSIHSGIGSGSPALEEQILYHLSYWVVAHFCSHFVVEFGIRKWDVSGFVLLFFQIALAITGFCGSIQNFIIFFISVKYAIGILIQVALSL